MLKRFKKRDIEGGQFTFGERIMLGRIVEAYTKEPCSDIELVKQVIEVLHDQQISDEGAAMLSGYTQKVLEAFLQWTRREAQECAVPQDNEAKQAGVDRLAEEIGDMGAVVDLAERFGWSFERVYKMPYLDVFTIWKVDAARAKFQKRLSEVLKRKRNKK